MRQRGFMEKFIERTTMTSPERNPISWNEIVFLNPVSEASQSWWLHVTVNIIYLTTETKSNRGMVFESRIEPCKIVLAARYVVVYWYSDVNKTPHRGIVSSLVQCKLE
jgi:hypothetical protein